jgi:hypothetical protein
VAYVLELQKPWQHERGGEMPGNYSEVHKRTILG